MDPTVLSNPGEEWNVIGEIPGKAKKISTTAEATDFFPERTL
jgi:hypothetical protein